MTRSRTLYFTLLAGAALLTAACGGGSVSQVTPLPDRAPATMTPTVQPTEVAAAAAEATATVTPTPSTTPRPVTAAGGGDALGDAGPTPTPQSNGLAAGEARAIAMQTDIPMQPDIEEPLTFDSYPVTITFDDFYAGYDMRRGMLLTDKLMSLDGQQIVIEGYVAPPLKPRIDFFVLTRIQLAFCPFCSADTEWPADIALVYMPTQDVVDTAYPVRVTGQLELGFSTDADTGMVSRIRIYAESIETLN